uniref:F-box domain-containing protein n=1 Tax=Caenorhabditis tropicalis TaxID=1561998 RepID=A0A1I7TE88_9PELO
MLFLGNLRKLTKLTLSGISNVDDTICQQISTCTKLNFLDLNYCLKIQTAGLQCILSCLNSLTHLEVLGIRAYSHQLLTQLSYYPKSIISDSVEFFSFSLPPIPTSSLVQG